MAQICEIYDHYVDYSCSVPEIDRLTVQDMVQRHRTIRKNKFPFIVACERGGKVPSRNKKKNQQGEELILPDRVIGFAYADDYHDLRGMYRFAAEAEVYTHSAYFMKGVAKCLLDKLMGLMDQGYMERGGFDIVGDDLDGTGASRVIQNIIIHLPYEKPERLEWVSRWLTEWLEFKQVGHLEDIGNKNEKR